jgi:hypothetical protein
MAIDRGDIEGLHHCLDRLEPALSGHPVPWDDDAMAELRAAYAERSLGASPASPKA